MKTPDHAILKQRTLRQQGFTLVELSIVLLLIAGMVGILVGAKSLLFSSQVHTTVGEAQKYIQAIQVFKQQFNNLPGDFRGATARWLTRDANTTNGDGNGLIATDTEGFAAWQHLRMSGILPNNNFTGLGGALTPGTNLPASAAFKGAGFQLAGSFSVFGTLLGNVLLLGNKNGTTEMSYGVMIARDADALDRKADDGVPSSGNIFGASGKEFTSTPGCTNKLWSGTAPATYTISDKTKGCFIAFRLTNDKF